MRSTLLLMLLFGLSAAGCVHPIRTDSQIGPITAHLTADLQAKNCKPLVAMELEKGDDSKIAIVDVDGLLVNQNLTGPYSQGDNPVDLFREKLDVAAADAKVCAVVLRINSPGGAVTATDIMWRELHRFRAATHKPVVVCLMDHGCSGAYYLATAGSVIVAHPTTITGGIGVVFNSYNLEPLMGTASILYKAIKSGKNIDMGTVATALPPEVKKMLQGLGDDFHKRFREVVVNSRPGVNLDESTFDGRVFTADQALNLKLIDLIGYMPDAIAKARELTGHTKAKVIIYHRENDVARTPYATSPNQPLQNSLLPFSMPGLDRSRLPTFLYLWQPDPTLIRLGGM